MNNSKKPGRNYLNKKVLIGNWFEEQCSYKKNSYKHNSEYNSHYKKKQSTTYPSSVLWDARIRAEGCGIYRDYEREEDHPNFYENFSTTYDLSYHHFPSYYKSPMYGGKAATSYIEDPSEFIKSYGNLTRYGLLDTKKRIWNCDKYYPRGAVVTTHDVAYNRPENPSYKFTRWTRPTPVSGRFEKCYKPFPPDHPRVVRCNPITWESKEDEVGENCCCTF